MATSHARAELYPRVLRRIQRRWTRLVRSQNEAAEEALLVCPRSEAFLLHHLLKFGVHPAWQRGRRATFCALGESPPPPGTAPVLEVLPPEQWVWGDDGCCWITEGAAGWWVALTADSGSHHVTPQDARPRVAGHLCGPFAALCGETGPSLSRKTDQTLTWLVHLRVGEGGGNPGCL